MNPDTASQTWPWTFPTQPTTPAVKTGLQLQSDSRFLHKKAIREFFLGSLPRIFPVFFLSERYNLRCPVNRAMHGSFAGVIENINLNPGQ